MHSCRTERPAEARRFETRVDDGWIFFPFRARFIRLSRSLTPRADVEESAPVLTRPRRAGACVVFKCRHEKRPSRVRVVPVFPNERVMHSSPTPTERPFLPDAKNESVDAILGAAALKAEGDGKKKVIVTGCLAQRYAEDLAAEMPEVDVVMGFEEYKNLPASLGSMLGVETRPDEGTGNRGRVRVGTASPPFRPEALRKRLTPQHYAYLRVAEGCDHKCTFCAIPGFRGKFRSKPWTPLVEEAKALADTGARELCLIAEDTNQWGMDLKASDGRGLAELLEELASVDGIEWIRILYAYPSYFSDELITAIADIPQVAKYIDIPLQHITNLSLLRMNRPPRQHTEDLLYKLRDRIPGLALRTTFISGFPGETEEEHEELMKFCREFKFERLGAFAYSEEDGTPAAEYPDQVEMAVRELRRDQIIAQQQVGTRALSLSPPIPITDNRHAGSPSANVRISLACVFVLSLLRRAVTTKPWMETSAAEPVL